jgi:hypothetical protein
MADRSSGRVTLARGVRLALARRLLCEAVGENVRVGNLEPNRSLVSSELYEMKEDRFAWFSLAVIRSKKYFRRANKTEQSNRTEA